MLMVDCEGAEPSLPLATESTEAKTDCNDKVCEGTMPGTAERTEVGSTGGSCLRIRVWGVDDAFGVATLLTVLLPIRSVETAKAWLVVVGKSVVEDVDSEEKAALASKPLVAVFCSSCAICASCSASPAGTKVGFPRRL